jgi:hypothetical protein
MMMLTQVPLLNTSRIWNPESRSAAQIPILALLTMVRKSIWSPSEDINSELFYATRVNTILESEIGGAGTAIHVQSKACFIG